VKKAIIIVVMIGMLSWAIFDFLDTDEKNVAQSERTGEQEDSNEIEDTEEVEVGLYVGQQAPDFELQTLSGETVRLSDFRGKRVMVNFWATWCPPCRAEMPDMEKFYNAKDVEILAVNLTDTETSIGTVENFVDEFELTFPILLDSNLDVSFLYKIQPIPTTFMVDSNGIIRFHAFSALNYDLMVREFEKMN